MEKEWIRTGKGRGKGRDRENGWKEKGKRNENAKRRERRAWSRKWEVGNIARPGCQLPQ